MRRTAILPALALAVLLALGPALAAEAREVPALGGRADRIPAEVREGESFVLTITDPARLEAKGMANAQAGDRVEVRRVGRGTWSLKNLSRQSSLVLTGNVDLTGGN